MSETVKLIIEMPKEIYESRYGDECDEKDCLIIDTFTQAIANGIPLDDVKAELEKHQFSREYCCDHNIDTAIDMGMVHIILDNVGKAEGEDEE